MPNKKEETASFVIRFNQKIYDNEAGESEVQWRGNIRHVQGGDEKRFVEFDRAIGFIQEKLSDLTLSATEDKSPEQQKGILSKSFDIWKKVAASAPQVVMETIKDPKKQVEQLRNEIRHEMTQVSDVIGQKLEIDTWLGSSKSDFKELMSKLNDITNEMSALNSKVDLLAKKIKK